MVGKPVGMLDNAGVVQDQKQNLGMMVQIMNQVFFVQTVCDHFQILIIRQSTFFESISTYIAF
jgi:hypothetical protein